eukprot:Skav222972  [mRNA]  locus=scaffold1489:852205:852453:+ [translate_table: standard]
MLGLVDHVPLFLQNLGQCGSAASGRFAKPEQHAVQSTSVVVVPAASSRGSIIRFQAGSHRLLGIGGQHQLCSEVTSTVQSLM